MLDTWDDFLLHQTPQPFGVVATTDPRFFDRLYINVHDPEGSVFIVTGLGVYPNNNCMDGFACGVSGRRPFQYNGRFFRPLANDRANTVVGPLRFDVLQPMVQWKLELGPNPFSIEFDLTLEARFDPWDCEQIQKHYGNSTLFDMHHYVQACRYSGVIVVDGERFESDSFRGVRDRSWGVRPLAGISQLGGSPPPLGLHLWLNPQFEDASYLVIYHEDADGKPTYLEGGIKGGRFDGRRWSKLDYSLERAEGSMLQAGGAIRMADDKGKAHELHMSTTLPGIYMSGAGYGKTQGRFVGNHQEGDQYDLLVLAAEGEAVDGVVDSLARYESDDGQSGYGVMEYRISADHPRYGGHAQDEE